MPLITEQQSANAFLARGLACGEDPTEDLTERECWVCKTPLDDDEGVELDGTWFCHDDAYREGYEDGPDRYRDIS